MLNRNYGKLVDGAITYAPTQIKIGNTYYPAPTAEQYLAAGWKRVSDHIPPPHEGGYWAATGWIEVAIEKDSLDDKSVTYIERVYEWRKIQRTPEDFNAALEQHLRDERTARGYDEREPSDYKDSGIARWRQDALDWIAHRDAVMMYGLAILNEWKKTKVEPDYAAFVTGLPKIVWTIQDEPNTEEA